MFEFLICIIMKRILFVLFLTLISVISFSQSQYEVTVEGPDKIMKGILSRDIIQNDSTFTWFKQNQKGYTPDAGLVSTIKAKSSGLHFMVFTGTWCSDSQFIIPRFYSLSDAAAIPASHISLIGVDRNKKTLGFLSETLNVINVPTIIVLKDGKEIGRVVEYGKTGMWDKEIGEIISR